MPKDTQDDNVPIGDDEISLDADRLLSKLQSWKEDEKERASAAGETREDIGNFLELTGLNKQALAIGRKLDKMPDDKRADCLRSLDALFDILRDHWQGQTTPDMLDGK